MLGYGLHMETFMTRSILLLTALSLTTACTQVSGEIDGENPAGQQAFFIQEDEAYGEDGQIQVWLTDVPEDACATYNGFLEDFSEGLGSFSVDEVVDAYNDNLPEQVWLTVLTFRVDDVRDDLSGLEFQGVDWDDMLEDDDEMHAVSTYKSRDADEDDFEFGDIISGDFDFIEDWRSDNGGGKISGHTPDESIKGTFSSIFVDEDGDDLGELDVRFSAERCRSVEGEIY
ncbi:MAG: hypothetical protein ACI9VR_002292 [Cognaticolwellia sp.]